MRALNCGGWANPDVLFVEREGQAPLIVKDWGQRGRWVRRLLAPALVGHELRMLERVSGLPGTPGARGRVDRLAFAMEWIPGVPLARRSHAQSLPPAFFNALEGVLAGLASRGVLHLDLASPSNILATETLAPALVDLGGATGLPVPARLRRFVERRALRKLRSRFESEGRAIQPVPLEYAQLEAGSLRFRIRERGPLADPTPVLLLHDLGLSGRCFASWLAAAPELGRRLVAIDLPGFGGSRVGRGGLAPEQLAQRLTPLLRALRLKRCQLLGLGWGGRVAHALASAAAPLVQSALAIDPAAGPAEDVLAELANRPVAEQRTWLRESIPQELSPELRLELRGELDAVPGSTIRRALRGMRRAGAQSGGAARPEACALRRLCARELGPVLDDPARLRALLQG